MRLLALLLACVVSTLASAETQWIWTKKNQTVNQQVWGRAGFDLTKVPAKAELLASADNHCQIWVNGELIGGSDEWAHPFMADVAKHLKTGHNTIAVLGRNDAGIAAFALRLSEGKTVLLETTKSWKVIDANPDNGWTAATFDDAKWEVATVTAAMGASPWGDVFGSKGKVRVASGKKGGSGIVAAPESLILQPDFKADLIYTVPRDLQGSWVSLAVDPKGDFVAGDQGGVLWHVSLTDPAKPVVTKITTAFYGCHGLLFAHGYLYACTSERGKGDVWRLKDTKGDGSYAEQVMIRSFKGSGEHGPHQLVLDHDGSILAVAGNHTKLPDDEKPGAAVHRWDEEDILKKFEDPNGHAVGIKATGGWIGRMDKDGKNWERVIVGFRNPYDVAVAPDGDYFTYDSDMEWDMGAPWYRPTRINLATRGGELGWRSGSGNNPPFMADTQPAICDIGPGSPTGVVMGTGAKFPAKYQRVFFACDWTYATLYAIHLEPNGGGWTGKKEVFAAGMPFPVTDVVIRPNDGHMYVTVGGRGGQSALYRIRYVGNESTAPAAWYEATPEQKIRRELEAMREVAPSATALEKAWPLMGHADRWIRFAARIAVEHQPINGWRAKVAQVSGNPDFAINAALALTRAGTKEDLPAIMATIEKANAKKPSLALQHDRLRALQVAFARFGRPAENLAQALGKECASRLPSGDNGLDRQLAMLALFLDEPSAPAKILQAMKVAKNGAAVEADPEVLARSAGYSKAVIAAMAVTPASTRIGLAVYLARGTAGWTPELRKEFFRFLDELAQAKGGNSLKGFVRNIRKEALALAPESERAALEEVAPTTPRKAADPLPMAAGPGRVWAQADALTAWDKAKSGKSFDFENGQKMFAAALCSQCHRIGDNGGAQGPDLSGIGSRQGAADLLISIILPSAIVSDQYSNSVISRVDGGKITGRILNEEGDKLQLAMNPFDFAVQLSINRSDILAIDRDPISPMPVGLINSLNEQEVADLMAYMISGGNKADKLFAK